jgi:glutaredoxin
MRFVLLACLMACLATSGQVYKWTDATGKTVYGDQPPDESKAKQLRIQSYDQVVVKDWSQVLRSKSGAGSGSGVTMLSTAWCGVCKVARTYFRSKGIAFTDIDVEKSDAGARRYKELGGGGVPIILVGGKMMQGFGEEAFEEMRK